VKSLPGGMPKDQKSILILISEEARCPDSASVSKGSRGLRSPVPQYTA
jgi:hypothetical protein